MVYVMCLTSHPTAQCCGFTFLLDQTLRVSDVPGAGEGGVPHPAAHGPRIRAIVSCLDTRRPEP